MLLVLLRTAVFQSTLMFPMLFSMQLPVAFSVHFVDPKTFLGMMQMAVLSIPVH